MKLLTKEEYLELKKNREEWLKYCYRLCNSYKWNKKLLDPIARDLGYASSTTSIVISGKKYAREYLNMSEEIINAFKAPYNKNNINTKNNSVINKLISLENEEEILTLIFNSGCNVSEIKREINRFLRVHRKDLTEEEQKEIEKETIKKIEPIIKMKQKEFEEKRAKYNEEKKKSRELELVPIIEELFNKVINDEISEEQLIKELRRTKYNRYLNILKNYSYEFYNKYINKLIENKKINKQNIISLEAQVKVLINHIVNGIESDEGFRQFDIVDFYELYNISNIKMNNFIKSNNTLNINEIRLIRNFYNKFITSDEKLSNKDIEDCLNSVDEVNCKKDKHGFPIPNTGIKIKYEEKIYLIEYLINNNIPVTKQTYFALLKRLKKSLSGQKINNNLKARKPQ